jgi:hypothetical protein
MAAFGLLTAAFLVAAVRGSPAARREQIWRAFVHGSMVYMFWSVEVVAITAACLVVYVLFIADHLRSHRDSPWPRRGLAAPAHLVGMTGHLAIAAAMMLMLALMQWPSFFPGA